jgi:SAM-dependent methyltransferase
MFHPHGPTFWELARQALSSTERGYDLLAPKFDYTPFRTPDDLLARVAEHLEHYGQQQRGLDLGCGTGPGMIMLRKLCRDRVIGIDFSQGMLEVCRSRLQASSGGPALDLVRGEMLALPFFEAFDLAVCFGALGHILPAQEPRFVCQIAKALRPSGRFVFLTSYPPPMFSLRNLFCRSFNAAMHLRNALVAPPFIMYYLTFLLPAVHGLLESHDFEVQERSLGGPFPWLQLVVATKRTRPAPH